jgi:hypothetical protein
MYIVIRKFAYLKTPKYAATLHNDAGGSEGGGEHKTLKAVASHLWFRYGRDRIIAPSTRVIIETWEGFDAKDEPVTTQVVTDFDAMLARLSVTR